MFFAIPISTGKRLNALPSVTAALIIINLFIWLITARIDHREYEKRADIRREMWEIEESYFGDFRSMNSNIPLQEKDQIILEGKLIPLDSEDFKVWKKKQQEYELLWNNRIFTKVGFTPARFNILKLFTSLFIHGNLLHLFGNMLFLWLAGCNLESDIGWKKYLGLYLLFGLAATSFHYFLNPLSDMPTIGASGAIAGLMGAFMIRFYLTKIKFFYFIWILKPIWGTFRIPSFLCLPFWFIEQLISSKQQSGSNIAFGAHIGGFLAGLAVVFTLQIARLLPEEDPESDDEDDYLESSIKAVKKLKDKDTIIQHPNAENLSQLLTIVRAEPENIQALLALARMQYELGAIKDSAISYNMALGIILAQKDIENINLIFKEIRNKRLLKYISRNNNLQLVHLLDELKAYKDTVNMAILFIRLFPRDTERPDMLYKIYHICKTRLKDEVRAQKAAVLFRRDYPHLPQNFS